MREKLKNLASRTKAAAGRVRTGVTSKAQQLADLNGDGRVDAEDARIAAARAQEFAQPIIDEAAELGRAAARSQITKDAATGAAVGAAIAIPVPVIGPAAGAAVGAGLGVYKNLTSGKQSSGGAPSPGQKAKAIAAPDNPIDIHAELLKLDELREKGILSDREFQRQKRCLLAKARG